MIAALHALVGDQFLRLTTDYLASTICGIREICCSPYTPNNSRGNTSLLSLSVLIPEQRLVVPPAVENAFDKDGLGRDDESDGDAPLESRHAQSGQEIIALRSAERKCPEPVAELDDSLDIAFRTLFTRMRRDVFMQAVDVARSQGP